MKIIFFGYGYCAEFLTELIPKDWEKIGTHTNLPYDFEYKDFKKVTRYKFNEFIEQKNDLIKNSTHIFLLGAIDKIENYLPAFIKEFKLNIQRNLDVKI